MNCCSNPKVKDLSQGLGDDRHLYCVTCKSHTYRGQVYDRQQWEAWVNEVPMPIKADKI